MTRVWAAALAAALLAGLPLHPAAPAEPQITESELKAAMLYKFGSYIEWPDDTFADEHGPFTLGVVGADEIAAYLEGIVEGRTVNGRPVAVRRLRPGDSIAGIQVLFVGQAARARLEPLLVDARQHPVLVVTETENALALGSMINFVVAGDKVRFDVGLDSAVRSNLRISARLLAVARRVVTGQS